ncbi:MAG: Clp protease ClpP [Moheibacter sp.]
MKRQIQIFNFSIKNEADSDRLHVYIDGSIVDAETQEILRDWWGDETSVSFKSLRTQVNESGKKKISFWVNSYGGHVGDAMAIHDWIQIMDADPSYDIETIGIGMVCSAATYIVSAAKNSKITRNSWYMIHPVSGGIWGNVNDVENYAKTLRKFNDTIVDFYSNLTNKTAEQVNEWMNAETWFTGVQAVEYGFVKTTSVKEVHFSNKIDPAKFPYKSQNAIGALNIYNAFVPAENQEENLIINNSNMNKFIEAIVNAFKNANIISPKPADGEGGEGGKGTEGAEGAENNVTAISEETLTNALTTAFEGFDFSEMIDNRLTEMFKDGLPENITKSLSTLISNQISEGTKTISDSIETIKTELDDVKKDVSDNAGGAKPNGDEVKDKNDHTGIIWQKN